MACWPALLPTSLLGAHPLQSWQLGKSHLPLWEITVTIIEKEILVILSSRWEVPAHSSYKRIQVPPLTSKLQHHPCVLYTLNRSRPLVVNSTNFLPFFFLSWTISWSYRETGFGQWHFRGLKILNTKHCYSKALRQLFVIRKFLQNFTSMTSYGCCKQSSVFSGSWNQMLLCPFLGPTASSKSPPLEFSLQISFSLLILFGKTHFLLISSLPISFSIKKGKRINRKIKEVAPVFL